MDQEKGKLRRSRSALVFSLLVTISGCANAPKVDYTLYDIGAADGDGAADDRAPIAGSMPGAGAIYFTPAGTNLLISVASPPAASPPGATPDAARAGNVAGTGSPTPHAAQVLPSTKKSDQTIASAAQLNDLTFTAVPAPSSQFVIAMTPQETFYFKPNISATFPSGKSYLSEIGADAVDSSATDIATVAGISKDVAALAPPRSGAPAATPPPDPALLPIPYVLDLTTSEAGTCISRLPPGREDAHWCNLGDVKGWQYRLQIIGPRVGQPLYGEDGSGAFFLGGSSGSPGLAPTGIRTFPFAPCINVMLMIKSQAVSPSEHAAPSLLTPIPLTIADPSYVHTYLIPLKGTIDINGACGANLKSQSTTSVTALDDIKALTDGVASLKASQGMSTKAAVPAKSTAKKGDQRSP